MIGALGFGDVKVSNYRMLTSEKVTDSEVPMSRCAEASVYRKTQLVILNGGTVIAQRYIEEVISPLVVPFAQRIGARFKLMHDNSRTQSSHQTTSYRVA